MDGGLPFSVSADIPLQELEAQITELAGQLNAANYRWLLLIAEFDRRHGWNDGALQSCAHWLNFKVGLNLGAARERVRVAHALPGVPKIAAAMSRGELSYSKVRALTRVATPATEDTLLMIALHGTAYHVETTVRGFRWAMQAEDLSREARQQANRSLSYWYDSDGGLVLRARLPALAGAAFVKAIEAAMDTVPATETSVALGEERQLTYQARRADALAVVAETYLHSEGTSNTADRYQVVVHVDAETLKDECAGRCHIDNGPSLALETVRRLTCDSSLVRITETDTGEPLDVGRKTRSIPPAIRRALNVRDAGCCFPGCIHKRFVDAHHVEHWVDGGETKLSNLVTLCRAHHRLLHEGGMMVEARVGAGWCFRRPDGREYEPAYQGSASDYDWTMLRSANAAQGLRIGGDTASTRWRGERMDFGLAVASLCHQELRARHRNDVSAESAPG